jgi:hypothetical protein
MRLPRAPARLLLLSCLLLTAVGLRVSRADQTTVSFDSGDHMIFDNAALHGGSDVLLSGGTSSDGDGTVLQLGYYSGATAGNNFTGTWTPLTGQGSLSTATISGSSPTEQYNKTSIGDITAKFAGDGTFAMSLNFFAGSPTSGQSLPTGGSTPPLAIRFYNGTTIETSTFYNVVSDDSWLWITPTNASPSIPISLNDPGLKWLSVVQGQDANTAFHTTIPLSQVPEPATILTAAACAATLTIGALKRRRSS